MLLYLNLMGLAEHPLWCHCFLTGFISLISLILNLSGGLTTKCALGGRTQDLLWRKYDFLVMEKISHHHLVS